MTSEDYKAMSIARMDALQRHTDAHAAAVDVSDKQYDAFMSWCKKYEQIEECLIRTTTVKPEKQQEYEKLMSEQRVLRCESDKLKDDAAKLTLEAKMLWTEYMSIALRDEQEDTIRFTDENQ